MNDYILPNFTENINGKLQAITFKNLIDRQMESYIRALSEGMNYYDHETMIKYKSYDIERDTVCIEIKRAYENGDYIKIEINMTTFHLNNGFDKILHVMNDIGEIIFFHPTVTDDMIYELREKLGEEFDTSFKISF